MKRFALLVVPALAALLAASPASAIEYRSVSSHAILFDAPSTGARPLFILSPGTPVEVVVESGAWVRVRDLSGAMNWLEGAALSPQRTLMVTADLAAIRSAPDHGAAIAFEARRDVVLDLLAPPQAGWAHVRHRDGQTGYVRITEVWGL
jgi:SH3-like domain-containing protein